jgi:hypothetical protein
MIKRKYHAIDIGRIREYSSGMAGGTKSVIIDGIPPTTCIFCHKFTTSIDFDMDLHLYEDHRSELYRLSMGQGNNNEKGLYFSLDSRIEYAIHLGKKAACVAA